MDYDRKKDPVLIPTRVLSRTRLFMLCGTSDPPRRWIHSHRHKEDFIQHEKLPQGRRGKTTRVRKYEPRLTSVTVKDTGEVLGVRRLRNGCKELFKVLGLV